MHFTPKQLVPIMLGAAFGAAMVIGPPNRSAAEGNDWAAEMYAARLRDGMATVIQPDGRMRSMAISDPARMKTVSDAMQSNGRPVNQPLVIMMINGKMMIMEGNKAPGRDRWYEEMVGGG
jgi:hypothetical protein